MDRKWFLWGRPLPIAGVCVVGGEGRNSSEYHKTVHIMDMLLFLEEAKTALLIYCNLGVA